MGEYEVRLDPASGRNVYELKGNEGSVSLVPISQASQGFNTAGIVDQVNRRVKLLYEHYGEQDANLLGGFIMDLAASDLEDDDIMRLSRARMNLVNPARPWYQSAPVRHAGGAAGGAAIGAAVGSIVPFVGTAIGAVAGGIIGAIKPEAPNFIKDQTVDALARNVTGDETATSGGLVALAILGDADKTEGPMYWEQARENRNMRDYINKQSNWFKLGAFAAEVGTDPTSWVVPVKSVGHAGATIGEGTAVGVSRGLFKARTSLEDFERIASGQVKVSDVLRGQSMQDVIRASYGKSTKVQNLVRRIDYAKSRTEIASSVSHQTPFNDAGIEYLWQNRASAGGKGALAALIDMADPAAKVNKAIDLTSLGKKASVYAEAAEWHRSMIQSLGAKGESAFPHVQALPGQVEELQKTQFLMQKAEMEMRALGSIERIPTAAMAPELRDWYQGTRWANQTGLWAAPTFKQVNGALRSAGKASTNTLRGVFSMNPHGVIKVDEPWEMTQVRRLTNAFEMDSTRALKGRKASVVPWGKAESERFARRWSAAQYADGPTKARILAEEQKTYLTRHLGLTEDQYAHITQSFNNQLNTFVTYARKTKKGKIITETEPMIQGDLMNHIPILDAGTLRHVSRWGEDVLSQPARFTEATSEAMDKLNRLWKGMAVLKPSWAVRVIGLSEQPRLAIAGQPNFITHPMAALLASDLFHFGKALDGEAGTAFREFLEETGQKIPLASGPTITGTAAEAARIARSIDPRAGGSLAPSATRLGADNVDVYEWSKMVSPRDKRFYKEGWRNKILNGSFANDPLQKKFVWLWDRAPQGLNAAAKEKWIVEQATLWLRNDAIGQGWAVGQKVAPTDKALAAAARDRLTKLKRYTRGDENLIRNLGRVKKEDVFQVDPPSALPSAHWADTFKRPGQGMWDDITKRTVNASFKRLSADPSWALSRRGPLAYETISQLQRQAALLKAKGIDLDVEKLVTAVQNKSVSITAAERSILKNAQDIAGSKVKQVVYDLSESSRMADLARYLMPFGNAWQEEITRWAMLSWNRPHVPLALASMWHNRELMPWTSTDPVTGKDYLTVPMGHVVSRMVTGKWNPFTQAEEGVSFPLMYPWESVNMLTGNGLNPGGGPFVELPLKFLSDRGVGWAESLRSAMPFSSGKSYSEIIFPNAAVKQLRALTDEDQNARTGQMFKAALVYQMDQAGGDMDKVNVSQAEEHVKALGMINGIAKVVIGGGAAFDLPPGLSKMVDYAKWLYRTAEPDVADQLLLERYGAEASLWVQSLTKSKTGEPPTKEAQAYLVNAEVKPLAKKYGKVFWAMNAERAQGDFDPIIFQSQVENGERDGFPGGDELWRAAQVNIGWYRYSQLATARDSYLAQVGATSMSSKAAEPIMEWFKAEKQKLYDAYDGFERAQAGGVSDREQTRKENRRLLREYVSEPHAQDLINTEAVQEYFTMRDIVASTMQQMGYRSLLTQEAQGLNVRWKNSVEALLERYPDFRQVWGRLGLEYDPVIEE